MQPLYSFLRRRAAAVRPLCSLLAGLWLALLALAAPAQVPAFLDAASLNPGSLYGTSFGRATAVDAAGNQLVVGYFTGTITLGGTTLTSLGSGADILVAKRSGSTGAWLWAVRAGGTSDNYGYGAAVDASGNLLVTGMFAGTASFATSPTATSLTAVGASDIFVAKFAGTDGTCLWAVQAGGSNGEVGYGVAVDASGNALVTGSFAGAASFATSPTATTLSSAGGNDVYVAKFGTASGTCLWAVRAGGNSDDIGEGVAVDASGNALVAGTFQTTATFGTSPGTTSLLTAGSYDIFVAKFGAATGTCAWTVRAGSSGADFGFGVAADGSGNALVTGYFGATASFGATSLVSAGNVDIFVAKFGAASGTCLWAVRAGGSSGDAGYGIAADPSGDALVTGYIAATASFATSPSPTSLTSVGGNDVFVAKFAGTSGACAWAVRAGGSNNNGDVGYSIAADGSGNALVAGFFISTATFVTADDAVAPSTALFAARLAGSTGAWQSLGQASQGSTSLSRATATDATGNQLVTGYFTGTLVLGSTTLNSAGSNDVFVAKRSASTGAWLWAVRAGGTSDDYGYGVAVDGSGNVLVTGAFFGTAGFATSPTATSLTSAGNNDVFVASFAGTTGACSWAVQAGGSGFDVGNGLAVDGGGNALVTGSFESTASFATSPTATTLTSAGGTDVFVARFGAANGTCTWAVREGGSSGDVGSGIAFDGNSHLLVTGYFAGTATFGTVFGPVSLVSAGSNDVFVARFAAATGAGNWVVRVGGSSFETGNSVAADNNGNALVTGHFFSTVSFSTSPTATSLSSMGGADMFVAKFASANGACAWAVQAGGSAGNEVSYGVAADGDGNAFVTGYFEGTASFATSPTATTLTSAGGTDVFVARFGAANGTCAWAVRAGGSSADVGYGLAVDGGGNALVAGSFTSAASFGSTALMGGGGISTGFVARLGLPAPTLTGLSSVAELPGQAVVLTGTGFTNASTVSFGGVAAASVTYNSATSLTAVVPVAAAPGSSTVAVSNGGVSSAGSPTFEVLQVYRDVAASNCLATASTVVAGTGGTGAWRYLRLPGAGGAVVAAIEDTYNLGAVSASILALGTGTSAAVRRDGNRRYFLDRNFTLTASNKVFTGSSVRVRFFGLSSELARLTAADASATAANLKASQYSGPNEDCDLGNNDPAGSSSLLAAPATTLSGADWFTAEALVADHFSEFYLTGASQPLPVQLVAFTATAVPDQATVQLAWVTASETGSARFEVERSRDGVAYTKVGEAAAAGTSLTRRTYVYLDAAAPTGTSYYRLRLIDLDGSDAYSGVRTVTLGAGKLALYPNPAPGAAVLVGAAPGAVVRVLDALGRPVATATADASGTAALPAGLTPGVYVVRAGAGTVRLVVK